MKDLELLTAKIATAINDGDSDGCAELFRGLSEAERCVLAPPIIAVCSRILAQDQWDWFQGKTACLALHASATLREIQGLYSAPWSNDRLYDVLADRRPNWLDSWIKWELEQFGGNWRVVRRLVRDRIAKRTDSIPNYYLGMIPHRNGSVRETLDGDPELLDHEVWRLFEIEGRADVSLAQNEKYLRKGHADAGSWSATLVAFAQEGRIDRQRLLSASLAALQRGLPQFQAGWFSRFHEELEPSVEERSGLVESYLFLLSSPIPPTVSFALDALAQIQKAGRLDAGAFLQAVEPALHAREKRTAEIVLRMLTSIAVEQPERGEECAALVVTLIEHSAPDVQSKALGFVERFGCGERREERMASAATLVAPSLRARLNAADSPVSPVSVPADSRSQSTPEKWLRLAGITPTGVLEPLDLRQAGIPRLHGDNRILPIETVEELVPVYLRALETGGPPDDLERVLDGVARLCNDRPPSFDRLVSPLVKRARQLSRRWRTGASRPLSSLALAWLVREPCQGQFSDDDFDGFIGGRVQALAARVLEGVAQPLYSTPTHGGGWIDAEAAEMRSKLRNVTDGYDRTLGDLRLGLISPPAGIFRHPGDAVSIRWAATFMPSNRATVFDIGASAIADNLDWGEAEWSNQAYFDPLFEPDTPLGEAGLLLLVMGLAAKESGEGTIATDALIACIADGRVESASLGEALARAVTEVKVVIARIVKRLAQASNVSILHALTIQKAIEPLLAVANAKALRQLAQDLAVQCSGGELQREQLRIRLDRAERWASLA